MPELLNLDHVALQSEGNTLAMSIAAGQSLCVMGPSASGKSRLLSVIGGAERPTRGSVAASVRVLFAGRPALSRRTKPGALARRYTQSAQNATDILTALRLWEVRHKAVSQLTASQVAACELIEPLSQDQRLLVLDGQLDQLDPWALSGAAEGMGNALRRGSAIVVSTNRSDLVPFFDALIVLDREKIVFAGTPTDLIRSGVATELEISTSDPDGALALADPFTISIKESDNGVVLQAREGQTIAAKLLLEGYGSVKLVHLRRPSVDEVLQKLLGDS